MNHKSQTTLFEPTEEDLYQYAVSRPLGKKIDEAIKTIRLYEETALKINPKGYYVAFSGGKDSIVLEMLYKMAGVKYDPWYNNTTIDPPELIQFIRKHYSEVDWNHPKNSLMYEIANHSNGLPTHKARWCCEIFKEQGGKGFFKSIGVRGPESPRRKGLWRVMNNHKKDKTPILCPIVYWTDDDIWTFIHKEKMAYCCLYDEGYSRLGCIGCPLSGAKQQRKDFERWPKFENVWKKGAMRYWQKFKGVPTLRGKPRWIERFETFEEFWNWWLRTEEVTDQPDCQLWLW